MIVGAHRRAAQNYWKGLLRPLGGRKWTSSASDTKSLVGLGNRANTANLTAYRLYRRLSIGPVQLELARANGQPSGSPGYRCIKRISSKRHFQH